MNSFCDRDVRAPGKLIDFTGLERDLLEAIRDIPAAQRWVGGEVMIYAAGAIVPRTAEGDNCDGGAIRI
jgi:hypothetical protein